MPHTPSLRHRIRGRGILQNAYTLAINGRRTKYPPQVREYMETKGDIPIISMKVCRAPISGALQTLINLIGNGSVHIRENADYDALFHTSISFEDEVGNKTRVEKAQVVCIGDYMPVKDEESMDVEITEPITLNMMLNNALADEGIMILNYNPLTANCQKFVSSLLRSVGLLSPELYVFINQDVQQTVNSYMARIGTVFTDSAAFADNLIHGQGIKGRQIQSILVPIDDVKNVDEAVRLISDVYPTFNPKKVHETNNYYRFRIVSPKQFKSFETEHKHFADGREFLVVIGYK